MARGKGKRRGGSNTKKSQNANEAGHEPKKPRVDDRGFTEIKMDNVKFTQFYQNVGAFSMEEWHDFYETMRQPLPTTFRITGTKDYAVILRDHLMSAYFKHLDGLVIDGKSIPPPQPLGWYPDSLAWVIHAGRNELKKLPEYSRLHEFLVQETDLGNANRQEAVSMLPPLFLDVQSHHLVLDMCAAPGSKTAQIIEMLHANLAPGELPTGAIVANDIDEERSHMLVHQMKRLNSPCLLVTNNDSTIYPAIVSKSTGLPIQFDRVLCDVPCSGDGTMRKNKLIWRSWSYQQAYSLHQTQVEILSRGCQLLKEGGRLVYSTCSLNPIENEAVLQAVLQKYKGSLVLVDQSSSLPTLKRKPGLKQWKVQAGEGQFYDAFDNVPEDFRGKVRPSFFPSQDDFSLEKSMRVYPHFQNTGGFFIAVIEKTGPLCSMDQLIAIGQTNSNRTELQATAVSTAATVTPSAAQATKRPSKSASWNDPYLFQTPDSTAIRAVQSLYSLKSDFPFDQFAIRAITSQERNNLFLVSKSVKEFLVSENGQQFKIVYSGLQCFTRCEGASELKELESAIEPSSSHPEEDVPSPLPELPLAKGRLSTSVAYRIQYEALPFLFPYLTQKIVELKNGTDLMNLLEEDYPKLDTFTSEFEAVLKDLEMGCHIFVYRLYHSSPLNVPVWKGKTSLNLLVNKKEKKSIKERWQWIRETCSSLSL